jgi:thiamine transporter
MRYAALRSPQCGIFFIGPLGLIFSESRRKTMTQTKTRALTEGALMVAAATALSYVKLLELPQGGSVCIGMLPIFLYCARWGCKESFLASFAYGLLQLIFDGNYAWGPTSMLFDYVLAYGVLGVACLFRKQRGGVFVGTVVGCVCRFIVHFISGVTIYRIYEPTEVFNTTFTNPYLYSAVYNGSYVFIDMVLCLVITALLYRPLSRYFAPQETVAAVKRNQGPEL